jgi:hypothetical protein
LFFSISLFGIGEIKVAVSEGRKKSNAPERDSNKTGIFWKEKKFVSCFFFFFFLSRPYTDTLKMFPSIPLPLLTDSYKASHYLLYPPAKQASFFFFFFFQNMLIIKLHIQLHSSFIRFFSHWIYPVIPSNFTACVLDISNYRGLFILVIRPTS